MEQMAEELRENQKMVEEQNKTWNEKLREANEKAKILELQVRFYSSC